MRIKESILEEIWREEEYRTDYENEDSLLYELVEGPEDWSDGGKFQSAMMIFKDVKTGKHLACDITRSGSYFTYYHYDFDEHCYEVEYQERQITVKGWVAV